jgi:glycosyltransferase involved in cell wall biosynthesis
MKRTRVLLSAYQCAPGQGSVSQIGWEWYSRLTSRADVTLVTHIRNKPALERVGAPLPGSEVIFIDTEWFARPLYATAGKIFRRSQHAVFLISSLDFFVFDRAALRILKKQPPHSWDIIHAATPVSPIAATTLFRLGLPLITGPWNGGMTSPQTFRAIMRDDSAWVYRIRDLGRMLDRAIGCTKNAALILSATRASDQSVPAASRHKIRRMIENGVDLSVFHPGSWDPPPSKNVPLRIIFVGRLIPVKGIPLLLDAVAKVRNEFPLTLTIIGDGPIRAEVEAHVNQRALADIVTLTGNLPLPQVAQYMRNGHLFCLPSVRESGGAVLLESMACAVPVAAVNYGGPAEIVDDEVGRLLSAEGPDELASDLAALFRDVAAHPEEWRKRGIAGRRRAETKYGWDAKVDEACALYQEVIEKRRAG